MVRLSNKKGIYTVYSPVSELVPDYASLHSGSATSLQPPFSFSLYHSV